MPLCDPTKIVILGPQGPQGPQGIQGPQGPPGLMGPQGPIGNDVPGMVKDFAGPVANMPPGYLVCDWSYYPTVSYPALFAAIGYTWGGAGPNFRVPPPGLTTVGLDTLMVNISGAPYVGYIGGEEQHTLTVPEMPSHSHTYHGDSSGPGSGLGIAYFTNSTGNTDATGGSLPHNNMQPYAVMLKIIKY